MDEPGPPDPPQLAATRAEKTAYWGLLVLLLLTYVLTVADPDTLGGEAAHFVAAVVVLLMVGVGRRVRRLLGGWAGITAAVVVSAGIAGGLSAVGVDGARPIITAVLLLGAAAATLDRLFTRGEVTVDTVFAVLSIYLLIAFAFSSLFAAVQDISGDAFFDGGRYGDRSDFLYFSVVTLTTLGYGDFVAATSPGRALSALEALAGQLFLATVVARFVGLLRVRARAR